MFCTLASANNSILPSAKPRFQPPRLFRQGVQKAEVLKKSKPELTLPFLDSAFLPFPILVSKITIIFTVLRLKKETIDLYLMLKYCLEQLNFKAEAKKQHNELQANPVMVSVSRQKMWRVISNLIASAVKFSPSGASILVKMEEMVQDVLIPVRDRGIGIPLEIRDRIFEIFTNAKRTGTAGE